MSCATPRRPPPRADGVPLPGSKIDIGLQWWPETRHSGWPYAVDALDGAVGIGKTELPDAASARARPADDPGVRRSQ
jgi:hypothetical protein